MTVKIALPKSPPAITDGLILATEDVLTVYKNGNTVSNAAQKWELTLMFKKPPETPEVRKKHLNKIKNAAYISSFILNNLTVL